MVYKIQRIGHRVGLIYKVSYLFGINIEEVRNNLITFKIQGTT